jgi:potassium efflux system protein
VNADAVPPLTPTTVEEARAAVESDTGIEDGLKAKLQADYGKISEVLAEAESFDKQASLFKTALESGPKSTAEYLEKLSTLPSIEQAGKVDEKGTSTDVRSEVDATRASLKGLTDELALATDELRKAEGRPVEIGVRLPEAQRELSAIRSQWRTIEQANAKDSPTRKTERFSLQANYARLANEIEMLQQEQLSRSVREEELKARRDLLARQVENMQATAGALAATLDNQLTSDVDRILALAQRASEDLPNDQSVRDLATEVRELSRQFEKVVENYKQVEPAQREVTMRLEEVSEEYRVIQNELSLGSSGGDLAQVLLELSRRARPDALQESVPISVEKSRLIWFSVKRSLRSHAKVESRFAEQSSQSVQQLVAARKEVLDKLQMESRKLTQALAELEGKRRRYFDLCEEVQGSVAETLFGFQIRSCPPVGTKTLTGIPTGLAWLFSAEHWKEITNAFWYYRFRTFSVLLIAIGLILIRPRLIAALEETGPPTRRISTDRYAWTSKALLLTLLLSAPLPIVVALAAWVLTHIPNPSDWMLGLGEGFIRLIAITSIANFIVEACRQGGLGIIHFRWNEDLATRLSSTIKSIGFVYVPMMALASSSGFGDAFRFYDSVGRTAFIAAHAWTVYVLWRTLYYRTGTELEGQQSDSESRLSRLWRSVRYPLLIGSPVALMVVAGSGYLMTAADLSVGLFVSAGIIALGQVLHDMTIRWFEIRRRRLALTEAIEQRKARLLAETEEHAEPETDELLNFDEQEQLGLNLESAGDQTVAVVRLTSNLLVLFFLYRYWSAVVPLTATLDTVLVPLAGGLSVLTLVTSLLVGVVAVVIVRNLPGLLEFSVLRNSNLAAGTRNAIYTLCQYAVIGLALISISNVLQLDWAKFGWMAAALSVGLGFGLQEIVANFVCGLILLFERPIRVGDVVTIEGTTGSVTNINMRATTITNWDRQDLVVPNKNLITGTILNWTLSASVNRIVIPVGVAYGADTNQARKILLDVASEHPDILDDPKPLASFEQFADSSLNLVLRAYLPTLDKRIATTTDLHTEIAKRFAEAGIEIAYPQRDLNLGSGWDKLAPEGGSDESDLEFVKPNYRDLQ